MSFFERLVSGVEAAVEQALGVNLLDMIVQITATIILMIIVKKFFWGRITEFLQKRNQYMENELIEAETTNQEALQLKETREAELKEIRDKSKDYFENAKTRGEEEKKRIIDHAKKEADVILANGRKEIEAERNKAKIELEKEVVSIASLMAEKVIGKKIDEREFQDVTIKNIESSEEL
jgi:F-type H+-transporting ATPase subunit b